jgi:signal transduction histidine kinase
MEVARGVSRSHFCVRIPETTMKRVLLVDDSPEGRLPAVRELQRALADGEVVEVSDIDAFYAEIRDDSFDVVVTECRVGDMTWIDVFDAAKARDPYRPVVVFAATATLDDAVAAMKRGVDDYVVKAPDGFGRLTNAVAAASARAARRRTADQEQRQYAQERERLLAAADAANRAKDEFLAILSHELRTPLTSILGWARVLRAKAVVPPEVDRAIGVIERNARAMTALVDQLLDVAVIVAGRLELRLEPLDLGPVIQAALDGSAPAAEAKRIALAVAAPADGLVLQADAPRLVQAFENLVSNAVKFTPAGGQVSVQWRREAERVEVDVSDSGPGIPPAVRERVFMRFWQADSSATRAHGGLGIGLAIAKHVVEAHGGTIAVASPGRLGGATFVVRLPLAGPGERAAGRPRR